MIKQGNATIPTQTITIGSSGDCNNFLMDWEENNFTITVYATGGTAPYSYQWSTGETTDVITVNAPGLYMITITDSTGCVIMQEIEVN